jgi:FkbM family methyltransferase
MKNILKHFLARAGYNISCVRHIPLPLRDPSNLRTFEFDDAVCRLMHDVGPVLTFLQVGVYDGITHDPLRSHILQSGWKGVMVEPQGRCVVGLRELYRDRPDIHVLHAALDSQPGKRTLYTIEGPQAPAWTGGLASFDRETVAKHEQWCPGLSGMIREETVPCIPFEQALEKLPGQSLDILQIDTEGADGYILSLFPFHLSTPAIVHFEIKHLNQSEQETVFDRLLGHGYKLARSGGEDMLAVLDSDL